MNSIKKIAWITGDNFLDSDVPVIPEISKKNTIHWFVIFPLKRVNDYNCEYISAFSAEAGIRNENIRINSRLRAIRVISVYYRLIRKINMLKPDIIYINFLGLPYFSFLAYIFLNRKKVIFAAHDVVEHKNLKSRKYLGLYQRFIFRNFRNFHIFSKTQRAIFTKKFPGKKTFFAPQYLKTYGTCRTKSDEDSITFLFFGIIRENKGLEFLIEAANQLGATHKNKFKVIIAGKCDNWGYYEKRIACPEVFDLRIGLIPNDEIPGLFGRSHYLVLPYLDVTQSGPMLIAFNYNKPVIASNHPGFKEHITHGKNGFLFEPENSNELYRVMLGIVESNNSGYATLQKNLEEYVHQNISLEPIINSYTSFFNSVS